MALSIASTLQIAFDEVLDRMEEQQQAAQLASKRNVSGAELQLSSNGTWGTVQQQAPIKSGFVVTDADYGSAIVQNYPVALDQPDSALLGIRADDLRDDSFMKQWARTSSSRLLAEQNSKIANLVTNTGSLFYRAAVDGNIGSNGYDAIKQAHIMMKERQLACDGLTVLLNDRDAGRLSSDLANRSNMSGLPESTYKNGLIASQIAGADIYEASYLPTITGGASVSGAEVATTVSFKPESHVMVAGTKQPVDYRISGDIPVNAAAASGLNVGDWIEFAGVEACGLHDKTPTGEAQTFKIVSKNGSNIKVYPKPIALDDPDLDDDEKAYANVTTRITANTAIIRKNTDVSKRANIFWADDSIQILNANSGVEKLKEFADQTILMETLSSGTTVYFIYGSDMNGLSLNLRLFTWNGITNVDPSRNGSFVIA